MQLLFAKQNLIVFQSISTDIFKIIRPDKFPVSWDTEDIGHSAGKPKAHELHQVGRALSVDKWAKLSQKPSIS